MKVGKISEAVLKRSVLRPIANRRPEVLAGAGVGEDCAAVQTAEDEVLVLSTDPITGAKENIGILGVHTSVNDLATSGAEPVGILVSILLPPDAQESDLRRMMQEIEEACSRLDIQVLGGHTEVTEVVNCPVLTVTGVGKAKKDAFLATGGVTEGEDLIVTKWIGLEGTSIAAKAHSRRLLARYPADLVERAQAFDNYISILPEARIAAKLGASAMHDVTEGGIFGALWEVAEASGLGLEADLRRIPLRQETVEVCNFLDLNPYQLISGGSLLIAAKNGTQILAALHEADIPAVIVGRTTKGPARIVHNGGEIRYLEPPAADELYKI